MTAWPEASRPLMTIAVIEGTEIPQCSSLPPVYSNRSLPSLGSNAIRSIEIGQLRHAHAIDTHRQPTARIGHRRHFRRCGNLYQHRGAAGASSTRPWRPAYAMEAQLRAWIDHAILARDHLGSARCAGLFWHLGLALAPWRGADTRKLALYARGGSSSQQAPGGDTAGIRERRDARLG